MKAEDLRTKTPDELKTQLLDLKKEQFNLRFQLSQGQTENTARVRAVRRDIARVNTFLNAGQKGENAGAAPKNEKSAQKKKSTGKKSAA